MKGKLFFVFCGGSLNYIMFSISENPTLNLKINLWNNYKIYFDDHKIEIALVYPYRFYKNGEKTNEG